MSSPHAQKAQEAQLLSTAQAQMHLGLSAAQQTQLLDYLDLLEKWNRVYNLSALRTRAQMLSHHVLDCLAIIGPLRHWAQAQGLEQVRALDVGSGAGLPGLVIAICQPHWSVSCVDTVGKKAAFIQQAIAHLHLPQAQAHHARVEDLPGPYDLITSRAFAALADFVQITQHALSPSGFWLAMKSSRAEEEIQALNTTHQHMRIVQTDVLDVPFLDGAERCLVWLQRSSRSSLCADLKL